MRCLTLANELRQRSIDAMFVCQVLDGDLITHIEARGFKVFRRSGVDQRSKFDSLLPDWRDDAEFTKSHLQQIGDVDWVIVDHYGLDRGWEQEVRPFTKRIMVIDDLANRPHDCDLLLDQNDRANPPIRYQGLVPNNCRLLMGPRYALLRPEFREVGRSLRTRDGNIRRVLIFFAAGDPTDETTKALTAIRKLREPKIEVDVVIGSANPRREQIGKLCAAMPNVAFHCQVENMAELMARADLALGATGANSWERCCLGLPSIVISLAMNQESIAHALADDGLAIYLGKRAAVTAGMITAAVEELMRNPDRMKAMGRACAELTDGNGAKRVARALDSHPIVLRPAQIGDCASLYQWRNAEETRRYFHHPEPISIETHRDWLTSVLRNKSRSLLIAQRNDEPVGVLRYDCARTQCTVSIYLVPSQRGHGYGSRLLCAGHEWLRQNRQNIRQVRAEVVKANRASVEAFLQAGYVKGDGVFVKQIA